MTIGRGVDRRQMQGADEPRRAHATDAGHAGRQAKN